MAVRPSVETLPIAVARRGANATPPMFDGQEPTYRAVDACTHDRIGLVDDRFGVSRGATAAVAAPSKRYNLLELADTLASLPMPLTIRHARIVVVLDLCSSSQIMEDLLLSEKFDRYEAFLTCVKRWLMNWTDAHSPAKGRFELYKFTGDGWILLFPDTIGGQSLVQFMYSLCEMVNAELARHIIPSLSTMPPVVGATLGVESGTLVRMTMNERDEYVGRALNIACRLQDAVKDKESRGDCYKALVSARLYNERLAKASATYAVDATTCSLPNILAGSGFACRKIDFTTGAAGERLPWPVHETAGWTCARSNWGSPP